MGLRRGEHLQTYSLAVLELELECWNAGLLKSHFTCQRSVSTASAPLPLHRRVALTQHSTVGSLAFLDYFYSWKLDQFGFDPFC